MKVMRTQSVLIHKDHYLYEWCQTITQKANNLKNAVRYRQRQVLTARRKDYSSLSVNEKEVVDEIKSVMKTDILSSKSSLTYNFMYHLLQDGKNPDYYADGLPRQSAQWVIKQTIGDMDNFYAAVQSYKADPSKFKGAPELPGYAKKGGHCTVAVSNQDCTIKTNGKGQSLACLPYIKKNPLCLGFTNGTLKEVKVVPYNGIYKLQFQFEKEIGDFDTSRSSRIAAIDFGVDNLMAVTNNIGKPCLLYKGGIVKSINQFYNKKISAIKAAEMVKPGCPLTKDVKPKFVPTKESQTLCIKRDMGIKDFMFKTACHFIAWCVENRIDTIVFGVNKGWKHGVNIGGVNNQNFVQIPFAILRNIIKYKASEHGIHTVEQEESYTSKASFLDSDDIPVYGKEPDCVKFSGRRRPTKYKGMYKKDGFRGLYQSKDGTIINSDLNGSANILRKAFKSAFENNNKPDFSSVIIVKNPDAEFIIANQVEQSKTKRQALSKSKARRLVRKTA